MRDPTELIDQVRLLWHVLRRSGERLHARESVTIGMRGILEYLEAQGPSTVPRMARDRAVTRQHVQALVDALLEQGLVALRPNPAHARSRLVEPTPRGMKTIARMLERERRFYDRLACDLREREIREATRVLARVREALEEAP